MATARGVDGRILTNDGEFEAVRHPVRMIRLASKPDKGGRWLCCRAPWAPKATGCGTWQPILPGCSGTEPSRDRDKVLVQVYFLFRTGSGQGGDAGVTRSLSQASTTQDAHPAACVA
jgi:hypothetical protein